MIRFTLTPTAESIAGVTAMFERIEDIPLSFLWRAFPIAQAMYAEDVRRIFEAEGPGWKPLASRTIENREELDYPPGPILVREGWLLSSLTDMGFLPEMRAVKTMEGPEEHMTGAVVEESPTMSADGWIRFGTVDDRFLELQADRPMLPMEFEEQALGMRIEPELIKLLRQMEAESGL